jgi:hypothetical protein
MLHIGLKNYYWLRKKVKRWKYGKRAQVGMWKRINKKLNVSTIIVEGAACAHSADSA